MSLIALRSRWAQHFCDSVKLAYTAASSLITRPANDAGSSTFLSVAASLCTPNNKTRAFSERNAQTLFKLQLVSSACTTSELANNVQSRSNSCSQSRDNR